MCVCEGERRYSARVCVCMCVCVCEDLQFRVAVQQQCRVV